MELTSKQRAQLRALANGIDTIVQVGKDGMTENLVKQADEALEAREIIKCRVLENSMLTAREACEELRKLTRSEPVQVIGTKFVLYRKSHHKEFKDRIVLDSGAKKKAQTAEKEAPRRPGKAVPRKTDKPESRRTDRAAVRKSDKPVSPKSDKPAFPKSGKPTFRKTDKPVFQKADKPALRRTGKPVLRKKTER